MTLIRCGRCSEKIPSPSLLPCSVCFLPTCGECASWHREEEHAQAAKVTKFKEEPAAKPGKFPWGAKDPKKGKKEKDEELGSLSDA